MSDVILNPYLPLWEYIPDGEPRIFDNRLFIYGSHDFAGGHKGFCPGDYMAWSAPLDDLSQWSCHGVLYKRSETPDFDESDAMAAPDVVKGDDGRYYIYYNTNAQFICRIGVADKPEGPFVYYGDVSNKDSTPYNEYKMFDPGVLVDDDGRIYLYTGFCMPGPVPEQYKGMKSPFANTSLGFELDKDMKTIIGGPYAVIPGGNDTDGTGFEGHGFYEASSPRKINGKYVMVYSSEVSHEMAYALSDEPLKNYKYAGALVSSADLGFNGNTDPVMPYGNVHGSVVQLNGDWYIFYHRQTHGIECSRQGCAEKLPMREDGWWGMAEITSCGLNNGPLPCSREYNACYCCYLAGDAVSKEKLTVRESRLDSEPCIYEETDRDNEKNSLHYIRQIRNNTKVGYKYFDFNSPSGIIVRIRGEGDAVITVTIKNDKVIGKTTVTLNKDWQDVKIDIDKINGVNPLYFTFNCAILDFISFKFGF